MNSNEYVSNVFNIILKIKLPSDILNNIKEYWYDNSREVNQIEILNYFKNATSRYSLSQKNKIYDDCIDWVFKFNIAFYYNIIKEDISFRTNNCNKCGNYIYANLSYSKKQLYKKKLSYFMDEGVDENWFQPIVIKNHFKIAKWFYKTEFSNNNDIDIDIETDYKNPLVLENIISHNSCCKCFN
jgi:hypothetical protein